MSRVPELMIESALKPRTKALKDRGFEHETKMLDEALAVMAEVAEHPPALRNATLLIIPAIAREQLAAYQLIEPSDGQGVRWRLTDRGNEMAEVLRAVVPPEDPKRVAREAAELKRALRRTEAQFDIQDPDED
jgi:hypothetical protein